MKIDNRVWANGVWDLSVWADNVWLEAGATPVVTTAYEGGTSKIARELLNDDFIVVTKNHDEDDMMTILHAFFAVRRKQ